MSMQPFARAALVRLLVSCLVVVSGCDKSPRSQSSPTAPSAPETPPPPPVSGETIRLGDPISGTISSDSRCKFAHTTDPRFAELCNVYTVVPPEDGTLTIALRTIDHEALVLRFRTPAGDLVDTFCCAPVTGKTAAHGGVPMQIEVEYVGRPGGYPSSVSPVSYTVEPSLITGDLQGRGNARALVFGDATRTQMLPDARLEISDGPGAGQVAGFEPRTGLYTFYNLPVGFLHIRASAPGFEPVEQEISVGTELSPAIVLARTVPLPDSTHELGGHVPEPGSPNAWLTGVKVEILDGPLAGVFTLTDDDMGIYVLRSLPPGVITVRATYGALSDTETVDISGGRGIYLVFHLGPQ
jgi:hypothetical protein